MQKEIKKGLSSRAEGYIDLCILIVVFVSLITLALSVCNMFTERINMQQAADMVLEEAVKSGLTESDKLNSLIILYQQKSGYEIVIERLDGQSEKWVQLGEGIVVRVRKKTLLEGLGKLLNNEEFSLEVKKEGKSERYWKR